MRTIMESKGKLFFWHLGLFSSFQFLHLTNPEKTHKMLKQKVLRMTLQVTGYVLKQSHVVMVPDNIFGIRKFQNCQCFHLEIGSSNWL